MVVTLSTMSRLSSLRPVSGDGSTAMRVSGASTGFVVSEQTVTDAVASKRSSWTIATGRGLPV